MKPLLGRLLKLAVVNAFKRSCTVIKVDQGTSATVTAKLYSTISSRAISTTHFSCYKVEGNHSNRNSNSKSGTKVAINDLLLSMDSKSAHIPSMKEARKARKENTPKYPAGVITLQVMGSGAKGAPTSLYMFADQSRYLFNCGEGSQRLAHEHKMKLGKLEHIFVTSKQWDKIGGLLGMALTVQDIGVPVLTLHGPPGLEEIFSATCRFVVLRDLHIKARACLENEFFEDHVMRVDYIPLFSISTEASSPPSSPSQSKSPVRGKGSCNSPDTFALDEEERNIDYYANENVGGKRSLEIVREGGAKKMKVEEEESPSKDSTLSSIKCSLCYICRPKARQGTLLIDKCVEKGVPPGPLLGQLKAGNDVTLPNGQVVLAADVRSPDCLGPVFIIADCPSEDYLDSLIANPCWSKYKNVDKNDPESCQIMVHFTPSEILLNPKYVSWMESFGPSVQHLLLNDSCVSLGSEAVHKLQHKLHLIDENVFPLLYEGGERIRKAEAIPQDPLLRNIHPNQKTIIYLSESKLPAELEELQKKIKAPLVLGETLLQYLIRPHKGLNSSVVASTCAEEYRKAALAVEDFPGELKTLKEKLKAMEPSAENENHEESQDYPRILFLGTGSCIPNKGRNVSGILIQVSDNTRYLLDSGEGTYGQLFRFYGPSKIDQVLMEMKAIYISHLHADHHLGLVNILTKRITAFGQANVPFEPIFLFAPYQIMYWLNVYDSLFERIRYSFKLIPNSTLVQEYDGPHAVENIAEILQSLDLRSLETCAVRHCANSFGVAMVHKNGWKICYSGDTQPCDWFATLGRDSDVCIHEATMEDELVYEARAKQHSTTSEAIEIGEKMGAKFTLLTHFSQRYAKVPKIDDGLQPNVGIAFDSMMVRLSDLPRISLMYPALKALFVDDYEEMENKTQKKIRQRLRDEAKIASKAAAIASAPN